MTFSLHDRFKIILQRIPFGIGSNLLIPLIQLFFTIFVYRVPFRKFKHYINRKVPKIEANRIQTAIWNRIEQAIVVYDNLASPPAHGDYINMIMLARWLSVCGMRTIFVIVNDDRKSKDWKSLDATSRSSFVRFQQEIADVFLDKKMTSVEVYTWPEITKRLKGYDKTKIFIPFERHINKRKMVILHVFSTLNLLLVNGDKSLISQWLLTGKDFEYSEEPNNTHLIKGPYLTWNIRYSRIVTLMNNTESQIIFIYKYLSARFPEYKIVLLSDLKGCDFVKSIAQKYNLEIIFSKDIKKTGTYVDDALLVLNSKFYFQFSGGGMSNIPFFSMIPYLVLQKPLCFEKEYFNRGLIWAMKDQKFVALDETSPLNYEEIISSQK
jgi:hypothetical protein